MFNKKIISRMKHPAVPQIRGKTNRNEIQKIVEKNCNEFDFEDVEGGMDVYVSDVNHARATISKIKKTLSSKMEIKMSTRYAGLRKGKVRVLFVYSLRMGLQK
jgi:NMD protein affecting ribosome stability and mRNA decay